MACAMMTVADVERVLEKWAPKWAAGDRDNVGLQIGARSRQVSKILVALEITDRVISEAIQKKVDLILTHHPPLFRPPASITDSDNVGRFVLALAQNNIAVYSAHTNLDFTRNGVSFVLAQKLGLSEVKFLSPLAEKMVKIVVFVPSSHADRVATEMSKAGAGIIGNYSSCSFRVGGTGTFAGNKDSNPYVGTRGTLESVEEMRLEMITPRAIVDSIIRAIKSVHPYEEVAYDIYPLTNESADFGMGALGVLRREVSLGSFLRTIKRRLKAQSVRYGGQLGKGVKTVAVCGGSGSDLLEAAVHAGADVFVTADVRYHTFHSALGRIVLVDAGHWETEHGILEPLAKKLKDSALEAKTKVSVYITEHSTNPVRTI
jgi:dinuclear metal center YbgI/SA1388 family protein